MRTFNLICCGLIAAFFLVGCGGGGGDDVVLIANISGPDSIDEYGFDDFSVEASGDTCHDRENSDSD